MSFDTDTDGVFSPAGLTIIGEHVHERAVIREYFLARMVAAVDDPTRIHSDPTFTHQARPLDWQLPAFNLTMGDESSDFSNNGPDQVRRDIELSIDVIASELDSVGVERVVDQLDLGVSAIILEPTGYPASIMDVTPISSDAAFTNEGSRRFGKRRVTFRISYFTLLTEPIP